MLLLEAENLIIIALGEYMGCRFVCDTLID